MIAPDKRRGGEGALKSPILGSDRKFSKPLLWVLRYQLWNGSATLLLLKERQKMAVRGVLHSYI